MLKKFVYLMLVLGFCSSVSAGNIKDVEISNDYFSFTMPNKIKNACVVEKEDNGIFVIEKISAKSKEGGFAFGLQIYDNPEDYADMEDGRKIGELTDKKGKVYDVILIKPREIYYADGRKAAKNYQRLYDFADDVDIKGVNGNKYVKCQITKDED